MFDGPTGARFAPLRSPVPPARPAEPFDIAQQPERRPAGARFRAAGKHAARGRAPRGTLVGWRFAAIRTPAEPHDVPAPAAAHRNTSRSGCRAIDAPGFRAAFG